MLQILPQTPVHHAVSSPIWPSEHSVLHRPSFWSSCKLLYLGNISNVSNTMNRSRVKLGQLCKNLKHRVLYYCRSTYVSTKYQSEPLHRYLVWPFSNCNNTKYQTWPCYPYNLKPNLSRIRTILQFFGTLSHRNHHSFCVTVKPECTYK